MTNLADTQNNVDDIKSRTKADYAVLQARYHMLEEQLRDAEMRAEERLAEEQKRHRELLNRAEREALLQNENCEIRMRTFEQENNTLRDEIQRLRMHGEKQGIDFRNLEEKLERTRDSLLTVQQELVETKASNKRWAHFLAIWPCSQSDEVAKNSQKGFFEVEHTLSFFYKLNS